jgi:hypothetical protein
MEPKLNIWEGRCYNMIASRHIFRAVGTPPHSPLWPAALQDLVNLALPFGVGASEKHV